MPQGTLPGEVFEIKPAGSFVEGVAQLTYYLGLLNVLDPLKRSWNAGDPATYTPPTVVPLGAGAYAVVSLPVDGIILYQVIDFKQAAVAAGAYAVSRLQIQVSVSMIFQPSFAF